MILEMDTAERTEADRDTEEVSDSDSEVESRLWHLRMIMRQNQFCLQRKLFLNLHNNFMLKSNKNKLHKM